MLKKLTQIYLFIQIEFFFGTYSIQDKGLKSKQSIVDFLAEMHCLLSEMEMLLIWS